MKTIALCSTKGGCGKSTLASALAVAAVGDRKQVGMFDADPLGSLSWWWATRGNVDNPKLYSGSDTASEAVDILETAGVADYLFIDSGPGLLQALDPIIEAADIVLVPSKTSAFDLMGIDAVLETIKAANKPYLVVLNEIDPRSKMPATAREYLEGEGHPVAKQAIQSRTPYRAALTLGKTAPEIERDGKAAEEIRALWSEVKKTLAKGARHG